MGCWERRGARCPWWWVRESSLRRGEGRCLKVRQRRCSTDRELGRGRTYALARALAISGHMERCTSSAGCLLGSYPRTVVGQALLDFLWCLNLDLLGWALAARLARWRVACDCMALGLGSVEVCDDALVVLLQNVFWYALHSEDFDVETLSVGEGILDLVERLFVDLVHVDGETCEESVSVTDVCARQRMRKHLPPAVFSLFPHRSHLKCFAFWWEMRSLRSSKSRSPAWRKLAKRKRGRRCSGQWTDSSSTMDERGCPRRRGGRASSCPSRRLDSVS